MKSEKFLNVEVLWAATLYVTSMTCTQTQFHSAMTEASQLASGLPLLCFLWLAITASANSTQLQFWKARHFIQIYQGLPVHRTLCSALLHVFSRQALLYIFSRQPLGNISSWETCVAFSLHLRWLWWVKILLLHQPLLQNPAIITAPMQAEITVLSWLH